MTENPSFPISKAFPLLDMLIAAGHAEDVESVWHQSLMVAGITPAPEPTHSLIWNGGFEAPLLNGGLAWRYQPVTGAHLDLDQSTVHSGHLALRVVFDGTQNVDFADLWQYVVVQPSTRYSFNAYLRAEDLTTDSGIRFEIDDANQPASLHVLTPGASGTQPWALDDSEFMTGPATRILRIVLRRTPSALLANQIRGTAWVDDVSLIPTAPPTSSGQ
jgi:hypothetical protein